MVLGALWGALGCLWEHFGMPLGSLECLWLPFEPLATIGSHFALLVCTLGVLEALSGDL